MGSTPSGLPELVLNLNWTALEKGPWASEVNRKVRREWDGQPMPRGRAAWRCALAPWPRPHGAEPYWGRCVRNVEARKVQENRQGAVPLPRNAIISVVSAPIDRIYPPGKARAHARCREGGFTGVSGSISKSRPFRPNPELGLQLSRKRGFATNRVEVARVYRSQVYSGRVSQLGQSGVLGTCDRVSRHGVC